MLHECAPAMSAASAPTAKDRRPSSEAFALGESKKTSAPRTATTTGTSWMLIGRSYTTSSESDDEAENVKEAADHLLLFVALEHRVGARTNEKRTADFGGTERRR